MVVRHGRHGDHGAHRQLSQDPDGREQGLPLRWEDRSGNESRPCLTELRRGEEGIPMPATPTVVCGTEGREKTPHMMVWAPASPVIPYLGGA